jgi:hypothetical protein
MLKQYLAMCKRGIADRWLADVLRDSDAGSKVWLISVFAVAALEERDGD